MSILHPTHIHPPPPYLNNSWKSSPFLQQRRSTSSVARVATQGCAWAAAACGPSPPRGRSIIDNACRSVGRRG